METLKVIGDFIIKAPLLAIQVFIGTVIIRRILDLLVNIIKKDLKKTKEEQHKEEKWTNLN